VANITGWGRGTWGEGAWNEAIPVTVTGVEATGGVGSPLAAGGALVTETGLTGTVGFGDEQVEGTANVFPTGVSATASTTTPEAPAAAILTGQAATGVVGDASIEANVVVSLTSPPLAISSGNVVLESAYGVTGLSASGNIGIVFIWGQITIRPDQQANWSDITPSGAGPWSTIVPDQSADWKEVA
jgi:hypothetical protein